MPKVRGTVTTSDGRPIARAIVRFGGSELGHVQPVATDAEGRFELTPPWVPVDRDTQARLPKQSIVAFHPFEPLGGRAEISLDDPKSLDHVAVTLVPQEINQLLASIDSQIGVRKKLADPAEQKKNEERSLVGKPAPELDGVTWLNTDKPQMTLADFRGKYVLLDFWTTWCGPCHADFPGVRLLHDLYKDQGFVIIGVHDNSMPLAAIQADVKKESLDFPIVVDHADGRILEQYKAHGISGYPSYVLIGPDGNVVRDEDTTLGPSLRVYMIENVREVLLEAAHAALAASRLAHPSLAPRSRRFAKQSSVYSVRQSTGLPIVTQAGNLKGFTETPFVRRSAVGATRGLRGSGAASHGPIVSSRQQTFAEGG